MANIIIAGRTATITSEFQFDEIKRLKKYAPESLVLKDADKKPVFMIDVGAQSCVSAAGVVFNGEALDGSGKAVITMEIPASVTKDTVNTWVVDNIGTSITKLNELEATLAGALAEVDAAENAILESIAIVGIADECECGECDCECAE